MTETLDSVTFFRRVLIFLFSGWQVSDWMVIVNL